MAHKTWLDFGPDIEIIQQQMTVQPPDSGSVVVEDDGERITAVSWTHNGEPCSVSTAIVTDLES